MNKLAKFAKRYPDKWHTYARDKKTIDLLCAAVNCGHVKTNEHGQFKATQFLKDL